MILEFKDSNSNAIGYEPTKMLGIGALLAADFSKPSCANKAVMKKIAERNEIPTIKTKHLAFGFVASFLLAMTTTMIYGSNLVFMKSAASLEENLVIGLTLPNSQRDEYGYENIAVGGRRAAVSSIVPGGSSREPPKQTIYEPINECGNSERWLNSRRYGNIHNDTMFTEELAKTLLLNLDTILIPKSEQMPQILDQSLCHAKSQFLNSSVPISLDKKTVRLWAFRLIYLSIHYHQHRQAVPEAVARRKAGTCPTSDALQQKYDVGIFDYECPDAKYVALPLGGNGLGSNVRGGTVLAYLLGLGESSVFKTF